MIPEIHPVRVSMVPGSLATNSSTPIEIASEEMSDIEDPLLELLLRILESPRNPEVEEAAR